MVGSGIKKFASANGLSVKNGIAAGRYRNFLITLSEGAGWKMAVFSLTQESEEAMLYLLDWFNDKNNQKEYRISDFDITDMYVKIVFLDNPGTMKKMTAVIDIVCDRLNSKGVFASDKCAECKMPVDASATPVIVNGTAFYMHDGCARQFNEQSDIQNQETKANGNYAGGIFGAFIGALVGSIPWAIASYFGLFVGWCGFIIGIAAKKGYELLKGKDGKFKAVVIIIVTALAVVISELFTYSLLMAVEIRNDPELASYGLSFFEIIVNTVIIMIEDSEFGLAVIKDILIGFVFAGLGIFSTVKEVFSSNGKNSNKAVKM